MARRLRVSVLVLLALSIMAGAPASVVAKGTTTAMVKPASTAPTGASAPTAPAGASAPTAPTANGEKATVKPATATSDAKGDDGEAAYALDELPRSVPPRGAMRCPKVDLVDYRGDVLRESPVTRVYSGFRDRLVKLEHVVKDVAIEVYGRAPTRIVNVGTFVCRRMAAHPGWLSEHGIGNAIDVEGFDFGPLPKGATLPPGLHRSLKAGFEVRVQKHWRANAGIAAVHARFLKTLARRLIGRKDIFRVLLGPGYPGHSGHFHFDMTNFRMVQIFDEGQLLTADAPPSKR